MSLSDFNLITDRTQADVDRYTELKDKSLRGMTDDEKAEWQTQLKGAYNFTDMNRVEAAVEDLANRLTEAGYIVSPVIKEHLSRLRNCIKDMPDLVNLLHRNSRDKSVTNL